MLKLANGIGRSPVEIGFTIYSVTNIDPVAQSFKCDLKIFCRWHDGGMEHDCDMVALRETGKLANGVAFERDAHGRFPHYVVKEIDPDLVRLSIPEHQFTNAMDVSAVEGTHTVYLSPNDKPGYVRSERRYHGDFFQFMRLNAFPFDAQTLKVSLRLPKRTDAGRSFIQFHNSVGPQQEMKDWVRLAEWLRYEPRAQTSIDSKGRAKYIIEIPLVRRYDYYVWSILAVISSISFLAFVSFAINADDLPGRSSLVVTLLLTAVAFKLVISEILPKVSYWTLLDYYINASFLMLLIIALENGAVGIIANRAPQTFVEYELLIEGGTALSVFALWAIFHVWFIGNAIFTRRQETKGLDGLKLASEAAQERYRSYDVMRKRQATESSVRGGRSGSRVRDEPEQEEPPAPSGTGSSSKRGYQKLAEEPTQPETNSPLKA